MSRHRRSPCLDYNIDLSCLSHSAPYPFLSHSSPFPPFSLLSCPFSFLCSHHPNKRCCSPGNPCSPRCLPLILTPHQFSSSYSGSHLFHRLPSSLIIPVPPTALHGFDHNKTPSYMERLNSSFSYMDSVLDYLLWCKYRSSVLCPLDCI